MEVAGSIPVFTSDQRVAPIVEAWANFGADLSRASRKHGVPLPWLVGIMMAESKGNPFACSPCAICRAELCASGAGMRCCAFGLMQFIEPTAVAYGVTPTELVQNPGRAIDVAGELVGDLADRVGGMDIVRIAAAYNGGFNRCGKADSTFGWHTNGDYPMTVVQYGNTFVELELPEPASGGAAGALLATAGIGIAIAIYLERL